MSATSLLDDRVPAVEVRASEQFEPRLLPWEAEPYRLWSLWDMLKFAATDFVAIQAHISACQAALMVQLHRADVDVNEPVPDQGIKEEATHILAFVEQCEHLKLPMSLVAAQRLLANLTVPSFSVQQLERALGDLNRRIRDELSGRLFLYMPPEQAVLYEKPLDGWDKVTARFQCSFEVEEARKCLALERYTAAVFHLMRVTETAVLELQVFLQGVDVKANFGGVLRKLEDLAQKTKFKLLPDRLKPHTLFLESVLAQLHAVKDAWRDRVAHVDERIVPTETFTGEMAMGVHDATRLLMQKLADSLPPKS